MGISQTLQGGQVAVVVGVGVVIDSAPDHLQGVDDDEGGVRVLTEELLQLLSQSVTQDTALGAEVDAGWCVLCHIKQSVLDAELGVLQAEVQSRSLLYLHSPDGFALGNGHRQPQGQPGLPDLGRACEDVQTLGDQCVHHEVQRLERTAHQGFTVDGVELVHFNSPFLCC